MPMYTEARLLEEANSTIPSCRLASHDRKNWTRWGVFPPPREGGKGNRPGLWNEDDRRMFFDLAWLHTQNSGKDTLALGLWLHRGNRDELRDPGYEETSALRNVGTFLIAQLERTLERLIGARALQEPVPDAAYRHLDGILARSEALADILCERQAALTDDHISDEMVWGRVRVPPDDMLAIALPAEPVKRWDNSKEELQEKRWPVEYPNCHIPRWLQRQLHQVAVGLLASGSVYVRTGLWQPKASDEGRWTLPGLVDTVRGATMDKLEAARNRTRAGLVGEWLFEDGLWGPGPPTHESHWRKGIVSKEELIRAHMGDPRHLFGSPRLFEWTAIEIATQLLDLPPGPKADLGMLDMARSRWFKARTAAEKQDAALTQLFVHDVERELAYHVHEVRLEHYP